MANEWNMNKGSFGYQSSANNNTDTSDFTAGVVAGALLGAIGIAATAAAIDEVSTPSYYPTTSTRPTTSTSYDYELQALRRKEEERRKEEREVEAKHRRELAREMMKNRNYSIYKDAIERDGIRIADFCDSRNFSKKAAAKAVAIYTVLRIYGALSVNFHEFSESLYIDAEIYDEKNYRKVFLKVADSKVRFSFGLKEYTYYGSINMEHKPYISTTEPEFVQEFWKDLDRYLGAAY